MEECAAQPVGVLFARRGPPVCRDGDGGVIECSQVWHMCPCFYGWCLGGDAKDGDALHLACVPVGGVGACDEFKHGVLDPAGGSLAVGSGYDFVVVGEFVADVIDSPAFSRVVVHVVLGAGDVFALAPELGVVEQTHCG